MTSPTEPSLTHDPARRRRIALYGAPFAALVVLSTVGSAISPTLLVESPVALIAMSPLPRHLALVAPDMPATTYYAVAVSRLFLGDPFMYLLGRELGDEAVGYLASKLGKRAGAWLKKMDGFFRRNAAWLLLVYPGPVFCALAGAAKMRPLPFASLSLVGTFVWVTAIRLFGASFSGPILALRSFFERHTGAATAATAALVVGSLLWQRRRPEPEAALAPDESEPEEG